MVARNPEEGSSLPYLVNLPIGPAGTVLKVRDLWPRTTKLYCHQAAVSAKLSNGRKVCTEGFYPGHPSRDPVAGAGAPSSPNLGSATSQNPWRHRCADVLLVSMIVLAIDDLKSKGAGKWAHR
jgi:hypothetical protein